MGMCCYSDNGMNNGDVLLFKRVNSGWVFR